MPQILVNEKGAGQRLDQFIAQKISGHSRAFLKQQIIKRNILVNGKIKKPSYILKENDKIDVGIAIPEKQTLKPNKEIKLNIIYEDKDVIVIDKPAGIASHPARFECEDTIANALLAYYPPVKEVGDMPELRPGIVHRLDRETSGLMILAKNNSAFNWLKNQFAARKVEKKYTALVVGSPKEKQGIISKPIGKTKDFRKRTTIPLKGQKEATTSYWVLEKFPSALLHHPSVIPAKAEIQNAYQKTLDPRLRGDDKKTYPHKALYTLLETEPKTGRTHQIRVHLASIGHPIAGDKLYSFKKQVVPKELKRQFLHASYLKFMLPDGKIVELKSELPEDLKIILKNLE